jgi:hypothetical protein
MHRIVFRNDRRSGIESPATALGVVGQQIPGIPENGKAQVRESILDQDSILIGDQVWWTMILPQKTGEIVGIETMDFPELPHLITEGVEALSPVLLDSVYRKKHLESLKARILLTSFDSGSIGLT